MRAFRNRSRRRKRSGFEAARGVTITEVIVVIAVLGLLLALLLPAVQQARATSRKAECAVRLRDIGLALANFEAAHRHYPDSYKWRIHLLPHLEQDALAAQFRRLEQRSEGRTAGLPTQWSLSHPVAAFLCPADPLAQDGICVNYYGNLGSGLQAYGFNGFITPSVGPPFIYGAWNVRHERGPTRAADVTDGLSNTVAVSEAIISPQSTPDSRYAGAATRQQLLGFFWRTEGLLVKAKDLPELARQCRTSRERNAQVEGTDRGRLSWPSWDKGGVHWGAIIHGWAYDHVLPPNSPSCGVSYYGIYSATSHHSGGVNAVYGDGHVRFVSESIDGSIWQAAGTRNGAEVLGGEGGVI